MKKFNSRQLLMIGAAGPLFVALAITPSDAKSAHHSAPADIKRELPPAGPLPIPYPNVGKTAKPPKTYLRGNNGGNRKGGRY